VPSPLRFRFVLIVLMAALSAGCAGLPAPREGAVVPSSLTIQPHRPGVWVAVTPARIEGRMRGAGCHVAPVGRSASGMANGLSAPEPTDVVRLDHGRSADGVRWFLQRDATAPSITFCGVALYPEANGTRLVLRGVRGPRLAQATAMAESGTFLCACEALSR
jgi:hypothetical protein